LDYNSGTQLHIESTYTHQMLCCRITTLTFTFLTNFKISKFNKEHELPEDDLNKIETCWNVFKYFNLNILD